MLSNKNVLFNESFKLENSFELTQSFPGRVLDFGLKATPIMFGTFLAVYKQEVEELFVKIQDQFARIECFTSHWAWSLVIFLKPHFIFYYNVASQKKAILENL
jgi:hypothetical protein